MNTPQRKQNGYARKGNGFAPSAANSLDSWYQEHMMSGGRHGSSTASYWPDGDTTTLRHGCQMAIARF